MADRRVKWAAGKEDAFKDFMDYEIQAALSARASLEAKWRQWLEQYRAPASQPTKHFPFEGACLARDTEILTLGGWRKITDVRVGEHVLTRRDDSILEYKPVQGLVHQYAEKLYHFKSRSIDLMVTGNHTMLCEPQGKPGAVARMNADQLWGRTGYYLPQHGTYLDGDNPGLLWGRNAGAIAEFVGWYLAEGSCFRTGTNPTALAIAQSSTANYENRQRLERLMADCGFTWSASPSGYIVHKSSIPVALFTLLASSGLARTKQVPAICYTWSAGLLDRLLTGMVLGDGSIYDEYPMDTAPKVVYYSVSPWLANDVQAIAALIGLHARVRVRSRVGHGGVVAERKIEGVAPCYEVTICNSGRAKYDRAFKEVVEYNDFAYCVTVENHSIYVRRKGTANWVGNSNYVMPVTAIDVDQLYAKFIQTIHAPANLWTIEALNPGWTDAAKPIQDFMQWLDGTILQMEGVNKRAILEMVKLGTCLYKTDWLYERRAVWAYDDQGERVRAERTISHPIVDHVRLVDFLLPPYSYAIQPDEQGGAPWVAERHRIRVAKLESIADSSEPYLPNYGRLGVEKIKEWLSPSQVEHDDTIQALDYQQPSGMKGGQTFEQAVGQATDHSPGGTASQPRDDIEIWEVHARFATQGKSEDDVVVEYHVPTRTIVRATYLRYHHGRRPYEKAVYFPTEGFYGIGVCEQKEMFQAYISDLMNFQHDNVLLSNSLGIAAKGGSNIAPGEPIYPGKIWITDGNPKEELMPFQLGTVYQSLPALIASVEMTAQKRSGVSDLQSGNINALPSRTPATSVQALLEEGARRPDLTLKDLRRCLSIVGMRIIQLIQQHAQLVDSEGEKVLQASLSVLGDEAGIQVLQKLGLPLEQAEYGLGVLLTATNATANKETAKQSLMGLIQLKESTAPMYVQMMQMALQAWGTPIGQVALDNLQALSFLEKRLYEQFDLRNMSDLVTQIPKDPVQAIGDPTAALQFLPPGSPGAQGAPGAPPMEGPPGAAGAGSPAGV